jgi:hypothetical protein
MASKIKLPYVVLPGMIPKIFAKIKEAKAPDRFTQDFLKTKLGFKGGNYRQFIPLAKKLGLLNSDGTPTDLYKSFRNPTSSKAAIAMAARRGYSEIFERNVYAGDLPKDELKGLVVEITGLEPKDRVVQLICQTFETLKTEADFEKKLKETNKKDEPKEETVTTVTNETGFTESPSLDLRLGYTINLVLPKTDDPAVFNAIFKSLREHLLRK